jgi:transcriptional regulator with XRE-family HTH domain
MESRRGRQKVERGPVSDYVAGNVTVLRKARGLSQQELSQRLSDLGRPMLPSALSKIESRDRGVDVDDLVALAASLRVNPSRLLLPVDVWEQELAITPVLSAPGWAAWQWADGFAPLPAGSKGDGYTEAEMEDFQIHSRPSEARRTERHPLMVSTRRFVYSVSRVIHHATKKPVEVEVLSKMLGLARRNLERVAGELDAVEEEVNSRGQR